jgi:hypothetical protein
LPRRQSGRHTMNRTASGAWKKRRYGLGV